MKLVKKASGKTTIKMSKSEWTDMGKKAGWIKISQDYGGVHGGPKDWYKRAAQLRNAINGTDIQKTMDNLSHDPTMYGERHAIWKEAHNMLQYLEETKPIRTKALQFLHGRKEPLWEHNPPRGGREKSQADEQKASEILLPFCRDVIGRPQDTSRGAQQNLGSYNWWRQAYESNPELGNAASEISRWCDHDGSRLLPSWGSDFRWDARKTSATMEQYRQGLRKLHMNVAALKVLVESNVGKPMDMYLNDDQRETKNDFDNEPWAQRTKQQDPNQQI